VAVEAVLSCFLIPWTEPPETAPGNLGPPTPRYFPPDLSTSLCLPPICFRWAVFCVFRAAGRSL